MNTTDERPKIWIRIPYLGPRGAELLKKCVKKIKRNLNVAVNFIIIYETKKASYFTTKKDQIPNFSKSNVVYEVKCPGCGCTYIGKTERCLLTRLHEHTNQHKSSVGQHFYNCEQVQHIINMHLTYDRLHNTTSPSDTINVSNFIATLITTNAKVIHHALNRNHNFLLILEALYIKHNSPLLNSGLKASKELTLFS